jgi:hypothetical protein
VGEKGLKGDKGDRGERGEKGDKGDVGDSGLLTAKFPLVYDAQEKSVSIDEARLDKILKKILGGGKVSPQDMGWLASTGGGGKVAVYNNGSKITPDVRTLDFTGAGVTASKVGGKVTVNFTSTGGGSSGGVATVNGLSGAVGITGGTDISVVPTGQTLTINYTGSSVSNAVNSFNGLTGAVQGVSSANGLTGAVSFRAGAGITLSTSGGGISFGIHYGATGAGAPFSIASPTNLDKFLFQDNETGQMQIVSYSTILTKAAQVGEVLSTSSTYTQSNTNFVVQNASSGVTQMVSANNVFSSIDGGIYDDEMPL